MLVEDFNKKIIAKWLYLGVVMIMIQVLLGGITRLTGSGLSITEWKPIMGALPPLNNTQWIIAFEKYKQIGQYKYINSDFTLSNFKFIFFWEWLHRNWARLIGIVFFIPFLFFIAKGMIKKEMITNFIIIFFIGALQGLVGWLMVASGLNDNVLFVNYFKLATHFITALIALVVVYWYALYYSKKQNINFDFENINSNILASQKIKKLKILMLCILALLIIQLTYGAFMAGLKAAATAPTWPSINGSFLPNGLWQHSFYSQPINIHFVHRNLAYLITILIIVFTIKAKKINLNKRWTNIYLLPIVLVCLQVLLGIFTVLTANHPLRNAMGMFEWCAQLHQLIAMFLLLSIVRVLFYLFQNSLKNS